jgi:hypothetical protein
MKPDRFLLIAISSFSLWIEEPRTECMVLIPYAAITSLVVWSRNKKPGAILKATRLTNSDSDSPL